MNSKAIAREQLAGMFDRTNLKAFATMSDLEKLCREAKDIHAAFLPNILPILINTR